MRFAPSPTGYLHVGGARTALFNYLFARHHGGVFILRIEDTDRTRYHPEALDDILSGLRWLGLEWDEGPEVGGDYGPYFQSERVALYRDYARRLVEEGHAYYCYCSRERLEALREEQRRRGEWQGYDRRCRNLTARERADLEAQGMVPVVRLKVPLEGTISFHDVIRGDITVQSQQLEDAVLLKSDGFPTYHLANVVDDHLMEITHIMRADEWLASVPLHVILYDAFGWKPPVYAHLPVILDPSGKGKMSKRKTVGPGGQTYHVLVRDFREQGYLPEAMFNFLALLGWSYDDKTEIMTREELIQRFSLERVRPAPSAFSYQKLEWMNGVYIRQLAPEELAERLVPFLARGLGMSEEAVRARPELQGLAPLVQERLKTLGEVVEWVDFLFTDGLVDYDPTLLVRKVAPDEARRALRAAWEALQGLESFDAEHLEEALRSTMAQLGWKARPFFGLIRVAVTGKQVAPPLFESLALLGKERTLRRLEHALARLDEVERAG
ncbi:MAG: glutamate--tRNA ligase [Anaerolineae bacterium]|nr:glutamate--tRNA ligase [Anaerolineae bacterium]